MSKKYLFLVLVLVTILALAGCGKENDSISKGEEKGQSVASREVVDMKGNTISVPDEVDRYIVLWKSYTGIMVMLDEGKGLVGCDYDKEKSEDAWLFEICPNADDLVIVSEEISAEEVAELNVDVVFWQNSDCEELAKKLNDLGIAAVNIDFTDYDSLKKSVNVAAETLGTDFAHQKADEYNEYLDGVISRVNAIASGVSDNEKKTVLNLRSYETLRADGAQTMADTWINEIGAKNVVELKGNQFLEPEQILEWNPDIIVSSVAGDDKLIYEDEKYSSLDAVNNQTVYVNPCGIYSWNRYAVETPLQLLWAAKTFYPDYYSEIDIELEIRDFYKSFFDYSMSEADVKCILSANPPQK